MNLVQVAGRGTRHLAHRLRGRRANRKADRRRQPPVRFSIFSVRPQRPRPHHRPTAPTRTRPARLRTARRRRADRAGPGKTRAPRRQARSRAARACGDSRGSRLTDPGQCLTGSNLGRRTRARPEPRASDTEAGRGRGRTANGAAGQDLPPRSSPRFGTARVRGTPRSPMTLRGYSFTLRTRTCQANPEISVFVLGGCPMLVGGAPQAEDGGRPSRVLRAGAGTRPPRVSRASAGGPPAARVTGRAPEAVHCACHGRGPEGRLMHVSRARAGGPPDARVTGERRRASTARVTSGRRKPRAPRHPQSPLRSLRGSRARGPEAVRRGCYGAGAARKSWPTPAAVAGPVLAGR
ncbi:hypothetical protein CLV70_109116 [Pseudosporangium ferrugineum]|uniref:Uncharacterized protein n=1 Tax=Pseudosporangium ferrugineum TaxID=439699 RepID=A0A2T0S3H0_9ACTN|nr:hypothetical protein CLV70_109116 [Pseudosporangium ferrugineum]